MSGNLLGELQELKEEEKVIANMEGRMLEQLNRLKVEELALRSMITMNAEGANQPAPTEEDTYTSEAQQLESNEIPIDLNAQFINPGTGGFGVQGEEEEEEEEEEEDEAEDGEGYSSQLMELMQQMNRDNAQYES